MLVSALDKNLMSITVESNLFIFFSINFLVQGVIWNKCYDWNKSHDGKYEFVAESLEKAIGILKTVDGQKFEYGFS